MRGLTGSMMRLMMPPFPAASRPSKMITMRALVALTQSCSLTSSTCSLKISASYSFLPIFGWPLTPSSIDFDFLSFVDFLLIVLSGFLGVGRACLEAGLYSWQAKVRARHRRLWPCVFRRQYVGHSARLRAQQLRRMT